MSKEPKIKPIVIVGAGGMGRDTQWLIERINANLFFFSCRGVTLDGRITDSSVAETQIRIKMMQHAKRSVFLTASSKIGREFFYVMANVTDIDTIISEKPLPKEWQKQNAGENAPR